MRSGQPGIESCTAPLLINDRPEEVRGSTILMFADDVKLIKACETTVNHVALQRDIDEVWE